MHELGIVVHLIKTCENLAKENNAKEVKEITLEVGEVSGVVKEYFVDAFNWAKQKTEYLKNCQLNYITIEAISYCQDCKETYKTRLGRICPKCGKENTYLVSGKEVNIHDIKII